MQSQRRTQRRSKRCFKTSGVGQSGPTKYLRNMDKDKLCGSV